MCTRCAHANPLDLTFAAAVCFLVLSSRARRGLRSPSAPHSRLFRALVLLCEGSEEVPPACYYPTSLAIPSIRATRHLACVVKSTCFKRGMAAHLGPLVGGITQGTAAQREGTGSSRNRALRPRLEGVAAQGVPLGTGEVARRAAAQVQMQQGGTTAKMGAGTQG